MSLVPALAASAPATVIGQMPLPFPGLRPTLAASLGRPSAHPIRERVPHFMQALAEVLFGDRPLRQLQPWLDPATYAQLNEQVTDLSERTTRKNGIARGGGARIASIHISMVHDHVAEVAGRITHQGRSHAVAVRLEVQTTHRGALRWNCTAVKCA